MHGERLILQPLKRALRPVRPLLLPLWERIGPYLEPSETPKALRGTEQDFERYVTVPPARAGFSSRAEAAASTAASGGPIRAITRAEFDAMAKRHPYYRPRRRYLGAAARIADDLIERHGLRTALELGPHLMPLVVGADVIDLRPKLELPPPARVIKADATRSPWPFADREYDLFVALQVFEHLGERQAVAFREVCRVARHAIISLPIEWEMPNPADCHHRIPHERALSWFHPVVPTRVELGNPGPRLRLIYVFEDLPAPTTASGSPDPVPTPR